MRTKNLMVFFLAIVSLLLVATISAATTPLATITDVKVNGIYDQGNEDISIIAGESVYVTVYFTAIENASDVNMKVEIEGTKIDVDEVSAPFDVEAGKRYSKTLRLVAPYELQEEVSDDVALNIKIWNGDYKTEHPEITLRVQRAPYNVEVMSIDATSVVEAGQLLPVDVVLKNVGYSDLDDLYVSVAIPALNLQKQAYFGDLSALECSDDCDDDDAEDTVKGRVYLTVPYDAEAGVYTLEVEISNDDLTESATKQIVVENDFPSKVIATSSSKKVAVGEDAQYKLLIVNPTDKLKVFEVVTAADDDLSSSVDSTIVAVPAGTTRTVTVTASADAEGTYNFDISFLTGNAVETVNLTLDAEGRSITNPIVVLTIILAIIFLVLLVVLTVLLGKKPKTTEDFGESYY